MLEKYFKSTLCLQGISKIPQANVKYDSYKSNKDNLHNTGIVFFKHYILIVIFKNVYKKKVCISSEVRFAR